MHTNIQSLTEHCGLLRIAYYVVDGKFFGHSVTVRGKIIFQPFSCCFTHTTPAPFPLIFFVISGFSLAIVYSFNSRGVSHEYIFSLAVCLVILFNYFNDFSLFYKNEFSLYESDKYSKLCAVRLRLVLCTLDRCFTLCKRKKIVVFI